MLGIKTANPLPALFCAAFALVCLAWPVARWVAPVVTPRVILAPEDRWVLFVSLLPSTTLFAAALWSLFRYFRLAEFSSEAGTFMRRAGWLTIASGPLLWLGRVFENWWANGAPLAPNFLVAMFFLIVLGVVLCAFARVLERGKALEEEVEGFI